MLYKIKIYEKNTTKHYKKITYFILIIKVSFFLNQEKIVLLYRIRNQHRWVDKYY